MHAIAYVSSATSRFASSTTTDSLILGAGAFNQRHGVTGVLLHHGGNFFQYLEGPVPGLTPVYERVLNARGHHSIIELFNGPVPGRHFSKWTMGFAEATQSELQRISHACWSAELSGLTNSLPQRTPGLVLVLDFWERSQASCQRSLSR